MIKRNTKEEEEEEEERSYKARFYSGTWLRMNRFMEHVNKTRYEKNKKKKRYLKKSKNIIVSDYWS